MDAGSPMVAILAGALGAVLGLVADRFAVRWPEHDPDDAEHPANRPIGWRTAVVVITGAVAFALLPARFAGDPLALVAFGAWFVTLVVGLATDLDQRLLPDVLTLPVVPIALVYAISGLNPLVGDGWIAAVIAAGAFGMGDVKLLVGVGLLLGLARALGGVLVGLLLAGVVLVALLAARRIGRRSYVPFGPFLILGALWAVLVLQPG
jgi:leader peptidase (prepilin peptidase) / N-methyltransferase